MVKARRKNSIQSTPGMRHGARIRKHVTVEKHISPANTLPHPAVNRQQYPGLYSKYVNDGINRRQEHQTKTMIQYIIKIIIIVNKNIRNNLGISAILHPRTH